VVNIKCECGKVFVLLTSNTLKTSILGFINSDELLTEELFFRSQQLYIYSKLTPFFMSNKTLLPFCKGLSIVPDLKRINSVYVTSHNYFNIVLTVMHPSTPTSFKCSLASSFSRQNSARI
jgi:hypothetical protein